MGHIALAAPVTHIWFIKGTPSRLALLLDISPRALERVIYFSQFLITGVERGAEGQSHRAHQNWMRRTSWKRRRPRSSRPWSSCGRRATTASPRSKRPPKPARKQTKADAKERAATLRTTAKALDAAMAEVDGRKARRHYQLDGEMLVERGGEVAAAKLSKKLRHSAGEETGAGGTRTPRRRTRRWRRMSKPTNSRPVMTCSRRRRRSRSA